MHKEEFNDYFFVFYIIPLLMSLAIKIITTGTLELVISDIRLDSIQARVIGCAIIITCMNILYVVFVKIPKTQGGWDKVVKILYLLFKSSFFYIFILLLFSPFYLSVVPQLVRLIVYLSMLLLCFFQQFRFMKVFKQQINL